jgi:hypothetical protein
LRFAAEGQGRPGGHAMKVAKDLLGIALLLCSGVGAGVEPRCLLIRGEDNVTYNITGARVRPNIGQRAIRLTGTKTKKASYCMQGIVLDNISWTYIDQKCSQ